MQLSFPKSITDRQAANGGIVFSVLICLGIIAMGTWLINFELASAEGQGGSFMNGNWPTPPFGVGHRHGLASLVTNC